jgi:hypothetical protein
VPNSGNNELDDSNANLAQAGDGHAWSTQAASPNDLDHTKDPTPPDDDVTTVALEAYLASRLQQIGEVSHEKKENVGLKTGNGWDPNQIVEQVFKIEPISIKRAVDIAISANTGLRDRLVKSFRRRKRDLEVVGTPTVEFVPIWKVRGFHECYYIRNSSYKVNVKNDVVAVDMEGQSRDLILERKRSRFIPAAIMERLLRLGSFLSDDSKYFVITDALELATKSTDGELVVSGSGHKISLDDEAELTSWRSKRVFDEADLKVRGAQVRIREPVLSKEALLTQFREVVIRMPERFKQILSNKLQILELKRIYVPLIRIPLQKGLVPREAIVNGTSGELANARLLSLFE